MDSLVYMQAPDWMHRCRVLTISLILSGALNIGFVATHLFSALYGNRPLSEASLCQSSAHALREEMATLFRLSFPELIAYLTNKELVEEGYTKRDLALSALVGAHHFHLEKALSRLPSETTSLLLSPFQAVKLYNHLDEEDYAAIIRFAYQNKWPFTSKGIFQFLKKAAKKPRDMSLEQAFSITPEFSTLLLLFQKTHMPQDPLLLLDLVSEGTWEILESLTKEFSHSLSFSEEKRRNFLLRYLSLDSPTAAYLLVKTDPEFLKNQLDEKNLTLCIQQLKKNPETEQFCKELLQMAGTDAIWKTAAQQLYFFSEEVAPSHLERSAALAHFLPLPQIHQNIVSTPHREYLVKEGDNLWKIARQHGVEIKDLMQLNGLEKDALYPGMTLLIPSSNSARSATGNGSNPPR